MHRSMSFDSPDIMNPSEEFHPQESWRHIHDMKSPLTGGMDSPLCSKSPTFSGDVGDATQLFVETKEGSIFSLHPPLVRSSSPIQLYVPPHRKVGLNSSAEDIPFGRFELPETAALRESEASSNGNDTQFMLNLEDEEDSSWNSPYYSPEKSSHNSAYGVTALQGIRDKMEDMHCCLPDYNKFLNLDIPDKQSFYAIFDGHSGKRAAEYLQQKLPLYIGNHPQFLTDLRSAILDSFRKIDQEFLKTAIEEDLYDGSTAIVILRRGSKIITVNLGDSHAVACVNGSAQDITVTQTPSRADERARIERAGGWISEERELHMSRLHQMDLADPFIRQRANEVVRWLTVYRVNGELAVCRSIGDPDYKGEGLTKYPWCFPPSHSQTFTADLVIPDPEFLEIEVTSRTSFIIIACDGLWDVLSSQEAVDEVADIINRGGAPQEASECLAQLALRLGSSDNISVIVILLEHISNSN